MAELMAVFYEDLGLQVQWHVEDNRANALGTAGSGRASDADVQRAHGWVTRGASRGSRNVPGFQPQAFKTRRQALRPRYLQHEGCRTCYVEAVRALQDAGVRLRGDVLVAAVSGEIEKTRVCDAEPVRGAAATQPDRATSSRTAASPTCACSASRRQGRPWALRSALAQIRVHGNFIHTAFRASATRTRSSACTRCSRPCRNVGKRRVDSLSRREGNRQHRRDRCRFRLARLADAASCRPVPRRARPTDKADERRAARGARLRALARREVSLLRRVEGEVYVTAPGAEIDESHDMQAVDDARAGVRREARAGRDPLVQRCVGAVALRRADVELRGLRLD